MYSTIVVRGTVSHDFRVLDGTHYLRSSEKGTYQIKGTGVKCTQGCLKKETKGI